MRGPSVSKETGLLSLRQIVILTRVGSAQSVVFSQVVTILIESIVVATAALRVDQSIPAPHFQSISLNSTDSRPLQRLIIGSKQIESGP